MDAFLLVLFRLTGARRSGSPASTISRMTQAHWSRRERQRRCRFTPTVVGTWQYKIQVTDKNGSVQSTVHSFTCTESARNGFVEVSKTDPRFFAFSDRTPFVTPLVTVQHIRSQGDLEGTIAKLGQGGVRFIRWFPTTGRRRHQSVRRSDPVELELWRQLPCRRPGHGTRQAVELLALLLLGPAGALDRRRTISAVVPRQVSGEQVLAVSVGDSPPIVVCSPTNAQHSGCTARQSGWNDYAVTFTADSTGSPPLYIRGLYVSTDAPAPYDQVRSGSVRINEVSLQRDETGSGGWGPNLVSRGDADTWRYVDQNQAAIMDQLLTESEAAGGLSQVDPVPSRTTASSTSTMRTANWPTGRTATGGLVPTTFMRGMVRWCAGCNKPTCATSWPAGPYSPAIHSLEFVNESDLLRPGASSRPHVRQVRRRERRTSDPHQQLILWLLGGWLLQGPGLWGKYLDYSDQHWYANRDSHDDAADQHDLGRYCRQCAPVLLAVQAVCCSRWRLCQAIRAVGRPGWPFQAPRPQDPAIAAETTGTYYHKKVWAHVGLLGYTWTASGIRDCLMRRERQRFLTLRTTCTRFIRPTRNLWPASCSATAAMSNWARTWREPASSAAPARV